MTLYHGTSTDKQKDIEASGLQSGTYVTDDVTLASFYASCRAKKRNSEPLLVILETIASDILNYDENQSGDYLCWFFSNKVEPHRLELTCI